MPLLLRQNRYRTTAPLLVSHTHYTAPAVQKYSSKLQYPTCELKGLDRRYIVGKNKSGNYCKKTWGNVIYSMRNPLVERFGRCAARLKYEFSAKKNLPSSRSFRFFRSVYVQSAGTQRTITVQWRWSCKVTCVYTVNRACRAFSPSCDDDIDIILAARAGRRLVQIAFFSTYPSIMCPQKVRRLT